MRSTELALQELNEAGDWITSGRHPNASEAVEALLGGRREPPAGGRPVRVIEVNPLQVVPVGLADPRTEDEIKYCTVAFEWPGQTKGLFDGEGRDG